MLATLHENYKGGFRAVQTGLRYRGATLDGCLRPSACSVGCLSVCGMILLGILGSAQLAGQVVVPEVTRFTLDNGLPVSFIRVPNEPAFSVFTWIPSGLATDAPGHALWIRLVSRLSSQTAGESRDILRLDGTGLESWSRSDRWEQTLAEHARAFKGYEFTEDQFRLYLEDSRITASTSDMGGVDVPAALAVFGQGYRYGITHVAIGDDFAKATLTEVKAYRDARWRMLRDSRLCVIGDVPIERLRSRVSEYFGSLTGDGSIPPANGTAAGRGLKITWDGNTYLMASAWPLRDLSIEDQAGLLVVTEYLICELAARAQIEGWRLVSCGRLRFPEGESFVMIAAADAPEILPEARRYAMDQISVLRKRRGDPAVFQAARDQVRDRFLIPRIPWIEDPASEKPHDVSHTILAEFLRIRQDWSRIEWRYGDQRNALGHEVAKLTPDRVAAVVATCLPEDRRVSCTVKPKSSEADR